MEVAIVANRYQIENVLVSHVLVVNISVCVYILLVYSGYLHRTANAEPRFISLGKYFVPKAAPHPAKVS